MVAPDTPARATPATPTTGTGVVAPVVRWPRAGTGGAADGPARWLEFGKFQGLF